MTMMTWFKKRRLTSFGCGIGDGCHIPTAGLKLTLIL